MGTARRIYKNSLYSGASEIVSRLLQFIVMLYAARLMSKDHFGKFSFALSLSLIAIFLADMGINTLLIREIARDKKSASKYFVNAFFAKILLSILTFLAIFAALNLLNFPQDTRQIVYIIWAYTILLTFTELFFSIFRAFEMMFYDSCLKIFKMTLLAASSLYLLFNGYGVIAFSYAFVATEFIAVIAAFAVASKKFIKLKIRIDIQFMKSLLKKSLPFGLALVFGSIYFNISSVILSKMTNDSQVAIFSVAYNIALAIQFIPTVYTNAIYPVMSRYFKEKKSELRLIYERSFKYLYIIGLPISVGTYVLASRIVYFLYGKSYFEAIIVLQIVGWYLFIKFINFLLGTVLSSIDQQGKRMLGQGITAVFNIGLNIALIPKFGYVGAAWATFITEILLIVLYFWYVSKSFYFFNFTRLLAKPAIASLAMYAFIRLSIFGLVLTIIFSALVYFAVLLALRAFDGKDYDIVRRIFRNEKIQANL